MSRILALPRRPPVFDPRLIGPMTEWLREPTGTMQLHAIQAQGLVELPVAGGLFFAASVGAGKTLTAALAGTVLDDSRPLIVCPASVVDDTRKLIDQYARHWRVPPHLRVLSYHRISNRTPEQVRAEQAGGEAPPGVLERFFPPIPAGAPRPPRTIIFDEAHALKHVRRSARGRKVARFLASNRDIRVIILTATPEDESVRDWMHLMVWALKDRAPVPLKPSVQEEWGKLIDVPKVDSEGWSGSTSWQVLWPHLGECHDRDRARELFSSRLRETPGVIITRDSFESVPLTIHPIRLEHPPALDVHWYFLRKLWTTPSDWLLPDKQLGVWNVAQQLALGFWYDHDPQPPEDWSTARREWCRFCRDVLEDSREFDTEAQIRDACRTGRLPPHAWETWSAIKDEYDPEKHKLARWLSGHALDAAQRWGQGGGIIWSRFRAFAHALAERTGWPYFGELGLDAGGRHVRDSRAPTIIVSDASCTEGKNLQTGCGPTGEGYSRNLFTSPPRKTKVWEQRMGRTHRQLQRHPVTVDYFVGCLEHYVATMLAVTNATQTESIWTQPQKLLRWPVEHPPYEWATGPAYGETLTYETEHAHEIEIEKERRS